MSVSVISLLDLNGQTNSQDPERENNLRDVNDSRDDRNSRDRVRRVNKFSSVSRDLRGQLRCHPSLESFHVIAQAEAQPWKGKQSLGEGKKQTKPRRGDTFLTVSPLRGFIFLHALPRLRLPFQGCASAWAIT
jgi:hypothetical protein